MGFGKMIGKITEAAKRKKTNAVAKKAKDLKAKKDAAEAKSKTAEGIKERGFKSVKTKQKI